MRILCVTAKIYSQFNIYFSFFVSHFCIEYSIVMYLKCIYSFIQLHIIILINAILFITVFVFCL